MKVPNFSIFFQHVSMGTRIPSIIKINLSHCASVVERGRLSFLLMDDAGFDGGRLIEVVHGGIILRK